jgi:excisionase family DNA binding protein
MAPPKSDSKPKASGLLDRDTLITSPELAEYLKVPEGTLDQWASRGGGPFFHKVGAHRRYHPADVKAWLSECRHAATGDRRPAA